MVDVLTEITEKAMRELGLEEIQQIELNLLIDFDAICRQHHLRYSLGGGSLLGAIRHKGFIPWDDDIDVMMPRPDYDAFLQLCILEDLPFALNSYLNLDGYYELFAKVWKLGTHIEDKMIKGGYDIGVSIDVFPIDGLGNNEKEAFKTFKSTSLYREILNASHWKKYFRSKTHSVLIEPIRFGLFLISRFTNQRNLLNSIDEINRQHSFDESLYAGCVCGSYREQEIMKKATFEHYIDIDFEGHKFRAITNYDDYLTKHYGNYMSLPPADKRETHHTYTAYLV